MSTPNDNQAYKGHTYKVNRDTGYVEIDGQPITLTNTDPHFWARQYIDKTEALMVAKAAQPSPAAVEQALAEEKASAEKIGTTVQAAKGEMQCQLVERTLYDHVKRERDALQAQRDELLVALRKTAGYCKTQADFNSDEAALWSQCQQIAAAAIACATEGGHGQ